MTSKPQLLAWLMCDAVHVDPSTGKHTILGVFSGLRVRSFPAVHPRMFWFLSLTDVSVGEHQLRLTMGLGLGENEELFARPFESQSPMHRINLINELRNLKFAEPGEYSITIEVDDEPILVTTIGVTS